MVDQEMHGESWADIPGFEGLYQASIYGRVRSVDRFDDHGRRWKGRILKQFNNGHGYLTVSLSKSGKPRTRYVHHLVAAAFIGACPDGMQICHRDGNTNNCAAGNLRYDTCKGNHKDKIRHGTLMKGEGHANSKLTDAKVVEIRRLAKSKTQRAIALLFGISERTVRDVVIFRTWRHVDTRTDGPARW